MLPEKKFDFKGKYKHNLAFIRSAPERRLMSNTYRVRFTPTTLV